MRKTESGNKSAKRLVFANFVPCRLKKLVERMLRDLAETHKIISISAPEFSIMVVLAEQQGVSSRDINRTTTMDKATITRALDRLTDKGLILRSRSKKDSRLNQIRLTSKGRRAFAQIERAALEWERRFLSGVKVTELRELDRLLGKLEYNLDVLEGYTAAQTRAG